jgi:hypothetical protein
MDGLAHSMLEPSTPIPECLAQGKQTDRRRTPRRHRGESRHASRADDTRDTRGLQDTRRASFDARLGGVIGDRDRALEPPGRRP